MSKLKAFFIDFIVTLSVGLMAWGLWSGAIRAFYVMAFIFAGYGFISMSITLYRWLLEPPMELGNPIEAIIVAVSRFFGKPDPNEEGDIDVEVREKDKRRIGEGTYRH